jgi:hypothetical protein
MAYTKKEIYYLAVVPPAGVYKSFKNYNDLARFIRPYIFQGPVTIGTIDCEISGKICLDGSNPFDWCPDQSCPVGGCLKKLIKNLKNKDL